jgi:transposase
MNETFPKIVSEATAVGATIYFEDESGISLNIFSGRTWSLKGQTPVVYRSGQRTKRTMAAAITPDGQMYFETYSGGTSAERYRSFLESLNNLDDSTKFVIHDGLPSHRSKLVKEYVESTDGKLKLFQLPGYSPELNPDEWVWDNLKKRLGKRAHTSIDDLTEHAHEIMKEIESDTQLLSSFYSHVYA